jgi:UDP-N-acetylglucosamine--N-acetylmuramyl-(pentapeptide) pyrophosphoryl-undecaprenol N-acetylglucosamine transferase
MKSEYLVLFSGGTGGHVIPAVNYGNYLIDCNYNCTLFLDKRGLKYASQFKGKILCVSSAHFSGNIVYKLKSIFLLLFGLIQSFYYLFKIKPSHCFGFGSYASFTPLIVALFLKALRMTKIHLHEQNSIIGKVNLFFAPFSNNIFINFDNIVNSKSYYAKKIFHVGLPNDNKIIFKKRSVNIVKEKKLKILIFGGSQGSLNLNYGFLKIIKKLPNNYHKKLSILMQCPNKEATNIKNELKDLGVEYEIKNFFFNIYKILDSSDFVVARSGAGTINDIIQSQVPSILVPLPHSIYNHQYFNAKYMINKQAAQLVEEKDLGSDSAYFAFKRLFDNSDQRISMIKNLQKIKILDANILISKKVFK